MRKIFSFVIAMLSGVLAAENLLPDGEFIFGSASYMLGGNGNYIPVPHRTVPAKTSRSGSFRRSGGTKKRNIKEKH